MESTPYSESDARSDEQMQPLRDGDATTNADAAVDPAQAEWERTQAIDEANADLEDTTATGRDPSEIPDPEDEIPDDDLPASVEQPETQGEDPVSAELGEQGQGDLAPEDL